MYKNYLDYVCCPNCKSSLILENNFLICKKCDKKYAIENDVIRFDNTISSDLKLSIEKWDELYRKQIENNLYLKEFDNYEEKYASNVINQILKFKEKGGSYLEIGCGQFFNAVEISKEFDVLIGIDVCPNALFIAKKIFEKNDIKNYILIQGDILNMPIKSGCIDFLYGGGVIEHFKDTQKCVNELYRCLNDGGVSLNTIPLLNIGSLTYRQVWGNIPNLPILKQLAEFVHIKLLKGKHMIFGYEFSFTSGKIKRIHCRAGFKRKNIKIEKFEVDLVFEFLPKFLRKYAVYLANNCFLFWPMIKVVAKKQN